MTARYYGIEVGGSLVGPVIESGSTTTKNIELVVADVAASGLAKAQLLLALDALKAKILMDPWPPA